MVSNAKTISIEFEQCSRLIKHPDARLVEYKQVGLNMYGTWVVPLHGVFYQIYCGTTETNTGWELINYSGTGYISGIHVRPVQVVTTRWEFVK